jgi:Protein of unknown function (DUF3352)
MENSSTVARSRGSASVAAAILVPALIIGGTASAFAAHALRQTSNTPRASAASLATVANILPASTLLFASFNATPGGSAGENLNNLEKAFTGQTGFNAIAQALTNSKPNKNCDLQRQVFSWIDGPITVAVTNASVLGSGKNAGTSGFVVVAATKPGQSVPGIVSRNGLGSAKPAKSHGGVSVYSIVSSNICNSKTGTSTTPAYAAIVNNTGILAPSLKDMNGEIDAAQSKAPTLGATAHYKAVAGKLPPTGFSYIYIDLPKVIAASSGTLSGISGGVAGAGSTSQVSKSFGATGISLTAQSNGLVMQGVQLLNSSLAGAASATPNQGASALPAGTLFYLSLDNLKGIINAALAAASAGSKSTAQSLAQVQLVFGSILNLMDGEFALGVLPIDASSIGALASISQTDTTGLPLAAMFNIAKHPEAASAISAILTALGSSTPLLKLSQGKSAHGNVEYLSKAGYGYSILKNWLVVSTSIKSVAASIESVLYGGAPNLTTGSSYKLAMGSVGSGKTGVMFLDIAQLRTLLETAFLPSATKANQAQYAKIRPFLLPIKALEVSGGVEDGGKTARFELLLAIGK